MAGSPRKERSVQMDHSETASWRSLVWKSWEDGPGLEEGKAVSTGESQSRDPRREEAGKQCTLIVTPT